MPLYRRAFRLTITTILEQDLFYSTYTPLSTSKLTSSLPRLTICTAAPEHDPRKLCLLRAGAHALKIVRARPFHLREGAVPILTGSKSYCVFFYFFITRTVRVRYRLHLTAATRIVVLGRKNRCNPMQNHVSECDISSYYVRGNFH